MSRLAVFLGLILVATSVCRAEKLPRELEDVGVTEHLGSNVTLDSPFTDESGQAVTLKNYFNGVKPVMFFLVYYECPNLCTMVLNGAIDSMKKISLVPGKDYEVVAVSIDPRETPDLAAKKKQAYLSEYGNTDGRGWHFLTGKPTAIGAISKELGFRYKWDDEQKQFAHASAFFVLTGDGKISNYFYGIMYPERDLRVALLEAGHGKIGNIVDKILLFCYHYDASTKKSVLMATRIMSLGGLVTVLVLGTFFVLAWRREHLAHV